MTLRQTGRRTACRRARGRVSSTQSSSCWPPRRRPQASAPTSKAALDARAASASAAAACRAGERPARLRAEARSAADAPARARPRRDRASHVLHPARARLSVRASCAAFATPRAPARCSTPIPMPCARAYLEQMIGVRRRLPPALHRGRRALRARAHRQVRARGSRRGICGSRRSAHGPRDAARAARPAGGGAAVARAPHPPARSAAARPADVRAAAARRGAQAPEPGRLTDLLLLALRIGADRAACIGRRGAVRDRAPDLRRWHGRERRDRDRRLAVDVARSGRKDLVPGCCRSRDASHRSVAP